MLEAIARTSVEASREVICAYFGNIGRNSRYFLLPIFLAVHPSAQPSAQDRRPGGIAFWKYTRIEFFFLETCQNFYGATPRFTKQQLVDSVQLGASWNVPKANSV